MAKEPKPHIVDVWIEGTSEDDVGQPWPLDYLDPKGIPPRVEFKFFNLGTRYNEEEDSWDDTDDIFETEKKTLGTLEYSFNSGRLNIYKHYGFEARKHTQNFTFISNDYEIPIETIQAEFGPDNDAQFERRPIQLANTFVPTGRTFNWQFEWYGSYPDDWLDGAAVREKYSVPNYFFIGDGLHDLRIELFKDSDDIDGTTKFDISRDLFLKDEMEGRGSVLDGVDDGEGNIDPLRYRWRNVKPGNFYIRCREVGNASVAHYVRVNNEEHSTWQIYEDMTQQGIFFYGFDTSDTGEEDSQFKITLECDPDAEEVSGKILKALTRPLLEVYLMPRRIALYARESGLDSEPTESDLVIGSGTRTIYRDDHDPHEEFTPSEASNPCLHAVISTTEGEPASGEVEINYDGVTLTGGMDCQSGSYCGGTYYNVAGPLWYCYGWSESCSGKTDIYPASTDTYANQLACINFVNQCDIDAAAGDNILINYTVKHEDATNRTHDHYIGLWYTQMPNKAFIYDEKHTKDLVEPHGDVPDLEDDTNKGTSYNEFFHLSYGGGYFPRYVGYESEHDQYTVKEEWHEWCACTDTNTPINSFSTDLTLLYNYFWMQSNGIMFYMCPNIPHFHDPLDFQTRNFIEDAGGTQEEIDDIVNPIRTLHFFTYDYDYSNHNAGDRGTYRDWEYKSECCPEYCWVWWNYYTHDVAKECTWFSYPDFTIDPGFTISCHYLDKDNLFDLPPYPNENQLGQAIFNKIANSPVWEDYYDFSFGYESRTYASKPFGFGIVPAKAGTLAAIVKIRSRVYYIWFKNDEDFKIWGRAKKLTNAGDRSTDDYELTDYEGYQLGFEDANCDNLIYGRYDEANKGISGIDPPLQYEYTDGTFATPTGFYNQCAGDGNRTVTHVGRTPVIVWDAVTQDNWVDGDAIVDDGAFIPPQSGPCRVPFHTGSTSNHFKRGTLKAPNIGAFELDAPIVVIGSRDNPVRDNPKNNRNMWTMNRAKEEMYFQ